MSGNKWLAPYWAAVFCVTISHCDAQDVPRATDTHDCAVPRLAAAWT